MRRRRVLSFVLSAAALLAACLPAPQPLAAGDEAAGHKALAEASAAIDALDTTSARKHLAAAKAELGTTPLWRFHDGRCDLAEGRCEQGLATFDRLFREYPDWAVVQNRTHAGVALVRLGRHEDADRAFQAALAAPAADRHPRLYINAAQNLVSWGKRDQALQRLDEGLAAFPKDLWLWDNRGWVLDLLGRRKEADAAYAMARTLHDKASPLPEPVAVLCPIAGRVRVMQGPDGAHSHRHLGCRFSWDLHADGDPKGDRTTNEAFRSFGWPVRAVADGVVVAARDGIPDHAPGQPDLARAEGNYVVLAFDGGKRFAQTYHLKSGSVAVKCGDVVRAGDVVGAIGNSGYSGEPHVCFSVSASRPPAPSVPVAFKGRKDPAVALIEGSVEEFD